MKEKIERVNLLHQIQQNYGISTGQISCVAFYATHDEILVETSQ